MILDTLENIHMYHLSPAIVQALTCGANLTEGDFGKERIPLSKTDYIIPAAYVTDPSPDRQMEAHRKYVDVMVMFEGEERIWVKPTAALGEICTPYDNTKDALLAIREDDCTAVRLRQGMFIILFPGDAHCPACAVNETGMPVKKGIGKVRVTEDM